VESANLIRNGIAALERALLMHDGFESDKLETE
jgi:hypothetical protein